MNRQEYINTLIENYRLAKEIRQKSLAELIRKQGVQQELEEYYKPITDTQKITSLTSYMALGGNKDSIVKYINDLTGIQSYEWNNFLKVFESQPKIISDVEAIKDSINSYSSDLINEVKAGNIDISNQIKMLQVIQNNFNDTIKDLQKHPDKAEDILNGSIIQKQFEHPIEQQIMKPNIDSSHSLMDSLTFHIDELNRAKENNDQNEITKSQIVIDSVLKGEGSKLNRKNLKLYVKEYGMNNYSDVWNTIRDSDSKFYQELLKVAKNTHDNPPPYDLRPKKVKGKGISFLPSDTKQQIFELTRLIGSRQSGNKNKESFNKINALVDSLRRSGKLSIEQSKKIYKLI